MQEVYLCLDVGGTEIKAAPLDKRGNFLAQIGRASCRERV